MKNNEQNMLVSLSSIKDQLACVSDDTTCPIHIAAQIDQIVELAKPVKAIVVPPVDIGDTAYFIINGQIYKATVSFLYWQRNQYGVSSEIRGAVQQYSCVSAPFEEWGITVFSSYEAAAAALSAQKEAR